MSAVSLIKAKNVRVGYTLIVDGLVLLVTAVGPSYDSKKELRLEYLSENGFKYVNNYMMDATVELLITKDETVKTVEETVIVQIEGKGAYRVLVKDLNTFWRSIRPNVGDRGPDMYLVDALGRTWIEGYNEWLLWEDCYPIHALQSAADHNKFAKAMKDLYVGQ